MAGICCPRPSLHIWVDLVFTDYPRPSPLMFLFLAQAVEGHCAPAALQRARGPAASQARVRPLGGHDPSAEDAVQDVCGEGGARLSAVVGKHQSGPFELFGGCIRATIAVTPLGYT